jgi:small subunit ribosomal protein S16
MILSREGVCLKKHLLEGVKKGAFDEATANARFEAWLQEKSISLQKVKEEEREQKKASLKARLEAEKEVNKAKAEVLAKKKADLAAEIAAKAKEAADAAAAAIKEKETPAEAPQTEQPAAPENVADAPKAADTTPAE